MVAMCESCSVARQNLEAVHAGNGVPMTEFHNSQRLRERKG